MDAVGRPDSAIGIFDSGVGGLSVWREVARQLPLQNLIYFADQAHVPYGSRPASQVQAFATAITRFLLERGARLIVVACNTASAAALYHLRATFPDVPFVGMEPAVKPAVENSRNGTVGVIATPTTFQGELFASLLRRFADGVQVLTQACPGWVEAVEAGELDAHTTEALLRASLTPLIDRGVDTLVLGCTHYPFLAPLIAQVVGPDVRVVDPAPSVARQARRLANRSGWLSRGKQKGKGIRTFYTSGDHESFSMQVTRLLDAPTAIKTWPALWKAGRLNSFS